MPAKRLPSTSSAPEPSIEAPVSPTSLAINEPVWFKEPDTDGLGFPSVGGRPKEVDSTNDVSVAIRTTLKQKPEELQKVVGLLIEDCYSKVPAIRFKARVQLVDFVGRDITNAKTVKNGNSVNIVFTTDPRGAK